MSVRIIKIIMFSFLALPILGNAAGIFVQPGASMSLGNGTVDMGCADTTIVGNLNIQSGAFINVRDFTVSGGNVNAGSGQLTLSGNWTNNGTFTPGTSLVAIQDGCSTTSSALTGDTDFYDFTTISTSGKTLLVAAGSTQVFNYNLTLEGIAGNPLLIRSSMVGNQAFFSLDPDGTQNIHAVDVGDNNALGGQWLAPGLPADFESVDSGNNFNWFLNTYQPVPVPTLSWLALIALVLALMTVAFRQRRLLSPLKHSET